MFEPLLPWLLAPLSGASTHHVSEGVAWHARLMVLAWAVLMPLGALVARYIKVMPQQDWPRQLDNKLWWHAHRWLQGAGVLVMSLGLVLALNEKADAASFVHACLGWSVCVVAWVQVCLGVYRGSKGGPTDAQMGGDHYDMSRWRRVFERVHKGLGWLAIAVSIPTIVLGLLVADAPRWMALTLLVWWTGCWLAFVGLHRRGRCMDTYQAIWGPDPVHPGNQLPCTGWGVRRYTAETWSQRCRNPISKK
jgi:hypothetical protein